MPFAAEKEDGTIIFPYQIDQQEAEFTCPYCKNELGYREEHYRKNGTKVRSHFYHKSQTGGESDTHKRLKTIVAEKLDQKFYYDNLWIDELYVDNYMPDILLNFQKEHEDLGQGIAVEVQHKNEDKQVIPPTEEYLKHEYSVYWIYSSEEKARKASPKFKRYNNYVGYYGDNGLELGTPIAVSDPYQDQVRKTSSNYWKNVETSDENKSVLSRIISLFQG